MQWGGLADALVGYYTVMPVDGGGAGLLAILLPVLIPLFLLALVVGILYMALVLSSCSAAFAADSLRQPTTAYDSLRQPTTAYDR